MAWINPAAPELVQVSKKKEIMAASGDMNNVDSPRSWTTVGKKLRWIGFSKALMDLIYIYL